MERARLSDRHPAVAPGRLVAALVPPPRFAAGTFITYLPDPAQPSQAAAVRELENFATTLQSTPRRLFARRTPGGPPGVYLDGGYGVGKTHLLCALWHASPEPRAYGTFIELTHLVGALGFSQTVSALTGHRLLAIDEFELDDPGDTVLISTLLAKLVQAGVKLAATSNTLPESLGEGRFAAADFLREIQGLAVHFRPIRIDGEDYRHRGRSAGPTPSTDENLLRRSGDVLGATCDTFDDLLAHLAALHPTRFGALLDGVQPVCIRAVRRIDDQAAALRLVVLADRLYDRDVPVLSSGVPWTAVFAEELLTGGYRKKYLRAISRLTALARQGQEFEPTAGASVGPEPTGP